jgi:hypothetical protein
VFALDDGFRKGKGGDKIGLKGDWLALGNLIFTIHGWTPTKHADRDEFYDYVLM